MIALTTEPNVRIHEAKTFTANLRKGRRIVPPPSEVIADDQMVVGRGGEAADLAHLHVNTDSKDKSTSQAQ
jgi:hypothetical protein